MADVRRRPVGRWPLLAAGVAVLVANPARAAAVLPTDAPVIPAALMGPIQPRAQAGGGARPGPLLLDVAVNGVALPGVVIAERLADGRIVLPEDAWAQARLRPAGPRLLLPDGRSGYALDAVAGVAFRLDEARLALTIRVPADALTGGALTLRRPPSSPMTRPALSGYLNYDLNLYAAQDGPLTYAGLFEGVAAGQWGRLISQGLVRGAAGGKAQAIRTDTYWQRDLPGRMESIVVGDAVSSAGAWSRPVRFAGLRYGRNFSLDPGYIPYPMPTLQGSAALPSTIDVLVNNQARTAVKVQPGPFELVGVPVTSGAGQINLVVRDLQGVQRVITQNYYLSPRMLARGLSDFSFEAGAPRYDYGYGDGDYRGAFVAAAYRYGLTDAITAEGRVEVENGRRAAGAAVTALLASFGVVTAAGSWSRGAAGGGESQGGRYLLGFERTTPRGGGAIQWEHFDAGYRPLAWRPQEVRPRDQLTAGAGIPLGRRVAVSVNYVRQTSWNGPPFETASALLTTTLPGGFSLSAYLGDSLAGRGMTGGLSLTRALGVRASFSAQAARTEDGRLTSSIGATRSPPVGPGWGWRVRASNTPTQRFSAGATVETGAGEFSADANVGDHANALRMAARGAFGWIGDTAFTARKIDDQAYAAVKVADLPGVPIYRDHQLAAITNSHGLAVVTGLRPYQDNRLEVSAEQLPFDVKIDGLASTVRPYARSGVSVEMPVRRSRNALVVLVRMDGSPPPLGAQAETAGRSFIVGKRGEVYLTDLEDRNALLVRWPGGACRAQVDLPLTHEAEPRLGPILCGAAP
jgi:outer membrane usher protein